MGRAGGDQVGDRVDAVEVNGRRSARASPVASPRQSGYCRHSHHQKSDFAHAFHLWKVLYLIGHHRVHLFRQLVSYP